LRRSLDDYLKSASSTQKHLQFRQLADSSNKYPEQRLEARLIDHSFRLSYSES